MSFSTFTEKTYEDINNYVNNILSHSEYKCQKIRDSKVIRCNVFGFGIFYKHEINLIDSPFLQRLRGIFQTSLALFTYPGATHSRFEHSLGCVINAQRMVQALKDKGAKIPENHIAELRLAALLHDVGHGPFSHASEKVYKQFSDLQEFFDKLKEENIGLFEGCSAHEILSYLVVTCESFDVFFKGEIASKYTEQESLCNLHLINFNNVGSMILGKPINNNLSMKFLSQIINGPFDMDKIDYLHRDGIQTGLKTEIDIDRLFLTLDKTTNNKEVVLSVDLSGATVLEQLFFNKSVLFSSVYHHHKIRSFLCLIISLFQFVKNNSFKMNGRDFSSPIHFIEIDEYEILNTNHKLEDGNDNNELNKFITEIKNRISLKRALVLSPNTVLDDKSFLKIAKIENNIQKIKGIESRIVKLIPELGNEPKKLFLDFPQRARFRESAIESLVRISTGENITLEDLYPIRGWVVGYSQFRYKAYLFCPQGFEKRVGKVAYEVFKEEGVLLNKYAFEMAKQDISLVHELFPSEK